MSRKKTDENGAVKPFVTNDGGLVQRIYEDTGLLPKSEKVKHEWLYTYSETDEEAIREKGLI